MPSIFDWSTTAGSNTSIGGITISEGCAAANLNDAIRQSMAITLSTFSASLQTFFAGSAALPIANGGTALTTTPGNGKLLIGNGTGYTLANLTAGSNISITNSSGGIQIDATSTTFTGGTLTTALITAASGTGGAMFRLPHGSAPTSPTNGDIWTTTAGVFARINGATVTIAGSGSGYAASGANTDITSLRDTTTLSSVGSSSISARTIGFRGLPDAMQSTGSQISITNSTIGYRVGNTAGGWLVDSGNFLADDGVWFLHNDSASTQDIVASGLYTLRLSGTTTTGTRTVAAHSIAKITKVGSTYYFICENCT